MDLDFVDHSVISEDHQICVSGSDEQVFDKVIVLRCRTQTTFSSAPLTLIGGNRRTLDVTAVGYGNRYILVGNQVFNRKLGAFVYNLCAPGVAKFFLDVLEFRFDHASQSSFHSPECFPILQCA